MATVTRNRRDGVMTVKDGSATPVATVLEFMESDFTYHDPEASEPIAVKNRKGELDHVKKNDPFNGWGSASFTLKYISKNAKSAICAPATSTAVAADLVPDAYPCVNLEYAIYDEDGTTVVETHKLYNVYFDPGKAVFSEGDEFDTLKLEGIMYGKVDAGVRKFSEIV